MLLAPAITTVPQRNLMEEKWTASGKLQDSFSLLGKDTILDPGLLHCQLHPVTPFSGGSVP